MQKQFNLRKVSYKKDMDNVIRNKLTLSCNTFQPIAIFRLSPAQYFTLPNYQNCPRWSEIRVRIPNGWKTMIFLSLTISLLNTLYPIHGWNILPKKYQSFLWIICRWHVPGNWHNSWKSWCKCHRDHFRLERYLLKAFPLLHSKKRGNLLPKSLQYTQTLLNANEFFGLHFIQLQIVNGSKALRRNPPTTSIRLRVFGHWYRLYQQL